MQEVTLLFGLGIILAGVIVPISTVAILKTKTPSNAK